MTVLIKYVGNGSFINGLPARDLDEEDWRVIGLQGRQAEVLASNLYKNVGGVSLVNNEDAAEAEPVDLKSLTVPELQKLAVARGIPCGGLKKAKLIEVLNGS